MNFYNPYFGVPNIMNAPSTSRGLLRGIFGRGINWSSILNNTQRTLGIINQAIPVVKQVTPIVNNARTMFQVMNEFKKIETPTAEAREVSSTEVVEDDNVEVVQNSRQFSNNQGPTFFV